MTQLSPLSILKRMNFFIKPKIQNIDELSKSDCACVCASNSATKRPRVESVHAEKKMRTKPKLTDNVCNLIFADTGAYKPVIPSLEGIDTRKRSCSIKSAHELTAEKCSLISGGTGGYKPPRVAYAGTNFTHITPSGALQHKDK